MISRSRLPAALCALACLALAASAAPAAATIGITNWDGAALVKPPAYEGPFLYKPYFPRGLLGAGEPPPTFPSGEVATKAGSHPDLAATAFSITTAITPAEQELPTEFLKDGIVEVPPGLLGNPQAVARCPVSDLRKEAGGSLCPPESQVGVARLIATKAYPSDAAYNENFFALYNMAPPPGVPGLLGFQTFGVQVFIVAKLRSDGDYGLTLSSLDANQTEPFKDFTFEVWGTPADHSHDLFHDACLGNGGLTGKECPSPEAAEPHAFLTLPTACLGPLRWGLAARGWGGGEDSASFLTHDLSEPPNPIGSEHCDEVPFDPTLQARPTTNVADSPSGLDFDLHVPQGDITDPAGTATAHLRDATVTLPEGLVVNPSGANGLDACSSAQAGLTTPIGAKPIHFSAEGAHCPDASKIGSVEVDTPLLDHPVKGALYIAAPHDNPFASLLALYIAIDDPESGTHATLAGEVHADPVTGQLATTVTENPQLPVEDVKLHLKEGAHAPLRTPATCGTYTTTSSLTPWSAPQSGPAATPSDSYQISQGPGGGCASSAAELPNAPSFDAGTVEPIAGHYSPLVIHLRREDGSQEFSKLTLTPPPGLLAKLAGTQSCPDSALAAAAAKSGKDEQASPSCPAASELGKVYAAAGAGPAPYHAPGTAYLTGPYKGAPLSLAVIAPAVAGPFDLGTIVVRTALRVNPVSAQISAETDPIPHILQGIPLDVRSVSVFLDRPEFTLNGTDCDPLAFGGHLLSTLGQSAPLSERFQLAECTRLAFKPKMSLSLKGGTKRGGHPALTAILKPRPGDANIGSLSVALPHSEFLDQAHIGTVCTRVQWAADACPAAAVYGTVSVTTPLLDQPLTGNVYLRSSDNPLPDLVPDLRGPPELPIRFEAAGRTDSIHGGIRNSFDFVPDAPFSKLVVKLKGGNKGLLINSRDICAKTYRATIRYGAHNGLARSEHPELAIGCKGKGKRGQRHHSREAKPRHPRAVK